MAKRGAKSVANTGMRGLGDLWARIGFLLGVRGELHRRARLRSRSLDLSNVRPVVADRFLWLRGRFRFSTPMATPDPICLVSVRDDLCDLRSVLGIRRVRAR